MTLNSFVNIIKGIDANASRYTAVGQRGDQYTVWHDYHVYSEMADGAPYANVLHVQVDYFTRTEGDQKAADFFAAFSGDPEITVDYRIDFEEDTRYIHHIFDCEVVLGGTLRV